MNRTIRQAGRKVKDFPGGIKSRRLQSTLMIEDKLQEEDLKYTGRMLSLEEELEAGD